MNLIVLEVIERLMTNRTDLSVSRGTFAHNDTVAYVTGDSVSVMGSDYDTGEWRYYDYDSE